MHSSGSTQSLNSVRTTSSFDEEEIGSIRPSSSAGVTPISVTTPSPASQSIRDRMSGVFSFFRSAVSFSPFSPITTETNQEDHYRELAATAADKMKAEGLRTATGQYYKIQCEAYTQAAKSQKHLATLPRSPENSFRISLEEKITAHEVELAESCTKALDGNQSPRTAIFLRDRITALDRAVRVLVRAREILTDSTPHENARLAAAGLEKAAASFVESAGDVAGLEQAESIAKNAENLLAPPKSPKKLFATRGTPSPETGYEV